MVEPGMILGVEVAITDGTELANVLVDLTEDGC